MVKKLFQGTGVAIVTPFRGDGSVDFSSLGDLVEYLIAGKADYIVALGTTGESATLSSDEKMAVINYILDSVSSRVPVVMGIGGNNTGNVISAVREVNDAKLPLAGILSVSPYYNKPSQAGLFQHYKKIATVSDYPVILYNVPGRTGGNISAATTIALAREVSNIVAIKEASGDLNQINQILKNKPKDFLVISGDDPLTLPMIALGASGAISVSANAFPEIYSEMVRFALSGRFKKAQGLQNALLDIMDAHFVEGNPSGVKASLTIKKLISNNLRLPLTPVSKETYAHIEKLIRELETNCKEFI